MPTAKRLVETADAFAAGGLAIVVGGVWYAALMRAVGAAAAYGPICGHTSALQAHCTGCYAALALVGLGLGLLASAGVRSGARP